MPKGGVLLANAALELAVAFGRRAGHEERRARRDVVVQAERVAAETESAGERERDQRERARARGPKWARLNCNPGPGPTSFRSCGPSLYSFYPAPGTDPSECVRVACGTRPLDERTRS